MKLETLAVILGLCLFGCSFRVGDLTALASRNVDVETEVTSRHVEGRDCVHLLFGFVPVSGSLVPNLQEAIDRALEKSTDANAMSDLAMYIDSLFIPYIYGRSCYRVRGDAVKVRR